MDHITQQARARTLRKLHDGPSPLVLPNAWDVAGAKIFEQIGFSAIGTTSAGIAASLGYPDGEHILRDEMLAVVARIAHAVSVPVTADVEAGYGESPAEVAQTARAAIAAGAAGVNLEDATGDPNHPLAGIAAQAARIRAMREIAEASDVPLVINARTDVYWLEVGEAGERFAAAVERLRAYRAAGADCLFVPGVSDEATIGRLARALKAPLNVLAGAGTPPIAALGRLGVARVSVGSAPMRATLGLVRRIAEELSREGTYTSMTAGAIPYAEVNRLLTGHV
ncbi:MAG: isocitrate lyase/PEP mutase family protein [Chloroflexota bacterium]